MQGYRAVPEYERRQLWLGLRLAPAICLTGIALGTALSSAPLLFAMAALGFLGGFVTRRHPFDYVYDVAIRPLIGGPPVPDSPGALPASWRRHGSSRSESRFSPAPKPWPGSWRCRCWRSEPS